MDDSHYDRLLTYKERAKRWLASKFVAYLPARPDDRALIAFAQRAEHGALVTEVPIIGWAVDASESLLQLERGDDDGSGVALVGRPILPVPVHSNVHWALILPNSLLYSDEFGSTYDCESWLADVTVMQERREENEKIQARKRIGSRESSPAE